MGEATFILVDENEKRVRIGHYASILDTFVTSLSKNPTTIEEFDQYYQEIKRNKLFEEGNRPKVPEELSLDTIKNVLGMEEKTDEEVLEYWKKVSLHYDDNYMSFEPDEKTKYDIPEVEEIMNEWKENDPDGEEFTDVYDYRKRTYGDDGIVVADLRKKKITYVSQAFNIPRESPTEVRKEHGLGGREYSLPKEWEIVVE